MKKMKKVGIILAVLTIYFNIGWALGTYYHNYIFAKDTKNFSIAQKILSGGWNILTTLGTNEKVLIFDQVFLMVCWPFHILVLVISWLTWVVYHLLWLIFAGGIAKIFGVG